MPAPIPLLAPVTSARFPASVICPAPFSIATTPAARVADRCDAGAYYGQESPTVRNASRAGAYLSFGGSGRIALGKRTGASLVYAPVRDCVGWDRCGGCPNP